jgi:hypothetical protein
MTSLVRNVVLMALTVMLCIVETIPAHGRAVRPATQQKFFGKWKLDKAQSRIAHPGDDDKSIQWRSYQPDGDRVKVAWGDGDGERGTYSAKCDGTVESAQAGNIRCRPAGSNTIEGEQLNNNDPLHRYYRRVLSSHGKIMSIIWYADAKRRRQTERFVYTKY